MLDTALVVVVGSGTRVATPLVAIVVEAGVEFVSFPMFEISVLDTMPPVVEAHSRVAMPLVVPVVAWSMLVVVVGCCGAVVGVVVAVVGLPDAVVVEAGSIF